MRSAGKVDIPCSSTEWSTQSITVCVLTVQKAYCVKLIVWFKKKKKGSTAIPIVQPAVHSTMGMKQSCIDSLFSLFDACHMEKWGRGRESKILWETSL